MSLRDAFNYIIKMKGRNVTISRPQQTGIAISMAPSNYMRSMEGPSDTSIEGREFVISKSELTRINFSLRRGDQIKDSELGAMTIKEIIEMYDMDGSILGFRVRIG